MRDLKGKRKAKSEEIGEKAKTFGDSGETSSSRHFELGEESSSEMFSATDSNEDAIKVLNRYFVQL